MLNEIEEVAKWLAQVETARAAFMAKDLDDWLSPLARWVLLMLPATYRLWAATRLTHFQPWIDDWAMPEIYSGSESKGAVDAAYSTAILLEHCRWHDVDFSRGAADVDRCFGQTQRPLM